MPNMKMRMQPRRKLRSLRTLRSTSVSLLRPAVPAEVDEGGDEEEDGPADPDGAEPVVFLAFVEDDLEAAGPDDEGAEAEAIEAERPWRLADVGGVVDEAVDHEERRGCRWGC